MEPDRAGQDALDALLDPVTSGIVSELEGGPRTLRQLCESTGLGAAEVESRLSPLRAGGLVAAAGEGPGASYSADASRIDEALSRSGHFDGAIDMVTKMDSFLN